MVWLCPGDGRGPGHFLGCMGMHDHASESSSSGTSAQPRPALAGRRTASQPVSEADPGSSPVVLVMPDPPLAERLSARLAKEQLTVSTVGSGSAAVRLASEQGVSMFITAADLPDVSGLELARMLKQQTPDGQAPPAVIVVAEAVDSRQIVRALREGADDYVASVSDELDVLAARVQAVLRRRGEAAAAQPEEASERAISVGAITIRPWAFNVLVNDRKVDLTLTQFRLLLMLAERPGRLVRPQEIQRHLAERGSQLRESSVKSHVYFLRQKLGEAGDQIENVRRVGYRLREA